ncbi:DnaD domain protein [Fodinisporobacter ferrooxydans]|uniref:DnaD domain protein n=1 Tax=Fodinisporobacter ferrooxydans TaxID=2901836 RepID=A0ABY4CH41_9BACL|nr:DnaD domain protein [Alicyclobacillaceae bacterium MYW30-H2]
MNLSHNRMELPMAAYFTVPFVSFPSLFMMEYQNIGLNETEMMLILHILTFQQVEQNVFPTMPDLAARMSIGSDEIFTVLQRLVNRGYITIVPMTTDGQVSENYDLSPVIGMLTHRLHPQPNMAPIEPVRSKNVFSVFESEFGRPLTAIEYEQIIQWLDTDGYDELMILEALRESVLSGKYNFKYIDRILFEWGKQNIRTMQQLQMHREEYKNKKSESKNQQPAKQNHEKHAAAKKTNTSKYDVFYEYYQQEASTT